MLVGEHLVISAENSNGDLLLESGDATRPELIDVVNEGLRNRAAGKGSQQGVKCSRSLGAIYLSGSEDGEVLLAFEIGE